MSKIKNESNDQKILADAGWRSVETNMAQTPYDRFVCRLGFTLQKSLYIEPLAGSVGFDLSTAKVGREFELRRTLCELFMERFSEQTCYVVDVNHGEWIFLPKELRLTSHFEPFPVDVSPWAEYVVFGNANFSHGVFCNPSNRHLVVFGDSFIARFSELLRNRQVPVEVAAEHCRTAS